jgi:hypothetical protein
MKPRPSSLFALCFLALALPGRAQLLIDGDFSVNPGSGTIVPADSTPAINSLGGGTYQYDTTKGETTGVGGTGGWTFESGGTASGTTQANSAIYVVATAGSPREANWVPNASAASPTGYVAQLDTISTVASWSTGNAIYQTVTVTVGQTYALSFYVNTETGGGKSNDSAADVIVTNATILSTGGASDTVLTSGTTQTGGVADLNAQKYGGVTGYQYSVNTSALANGSTSATWVGYTMTFTATGTTTQIAFADDPISANSNIALEEISLTTVPEPRAWGLILLVGVGLLVASRRLRAHLPGPRLAC